ncbi:related to polyadenylate-binding protein 3 [Melanopsichium pennsylvanicum]|uniref:Related to polyadenylate-binding protein 3 n=2 Tax=Melanopsichium pennsylvanicum TaxID=63383 RepID=A0AAJ5C5V6_9BASI|nr:protein mediates microtubule-dependent mRNA transport [Melanopsichium pennsylvanicum 4]SNX84914.1 related to polyadenylate-binding protein 3 [Melanopsichium pennsylvanicum]
MADSIYAPHNQAKLEASRPADAAASPASPPAHDQNGSIANSEPAIEEEQDDDLDRPHPHLTRPFLHISGVDATMTDKELAGLVFEKVLPVRLKIDRTVGEGQTASGTVEFQTLDKAEKAYAIVRPPIHLRIEKDDSVTELVAAAKTRLVKQLPPITDDALVYDLFRRFGPLKRAQCILTNPAGIHTGFKGMAVLEFYFEQDAQRAETEMHCADVGGKTISVAVDTTIRKVSASASEFRPSATPFVPGNGMSAAAPSFAPTATGSRSVSAGSAASIYATAAASSSNAAAQKASRGPLAYSNQASTYVDPCNLFIKSLDAELNSNDLFDTFKTFGHIVSARVMRDNDGKSREFGFVSFTSPDEARNALQAMDNAKIGSKKITVRLHEPKTMRQEKLAARFNAINAEGQDAGAASAATNGGASQSTSKADKRQSRSYFKAGVPSDANGLADEEQLRSLSNVVRDELLSGEFTRRVQQLPSIKEAQVDDIVSELLKLKLGDAVDALNNPISLIQRVNEARERLPQLELSTSGLSTPATPVTPGPLSSGHSDLLGVQTQRSVSGLSSSSSIADGNASSKERERLLKAVISVCEAGAPVEDITDMLASLPKKDRALILFNPEFLKQKVEEAKEILDITDESGEDLTHSRGTDGATAASAASNVLRDSSNGQSSASTAAAAVTDDTKSTTQTHTLSSLAALPALEIVKLANSPSNSGLPLPKADPEVVKSTDAFIDSLAGKAAHDQKQKLGDQLFKKIRTFGVKGAPKLTIHFLDSEDLRSLAHLMNSYEEVLKEKVNQKIAAGLNK